MKKKFIIITSILFILSFLCITYSFAANDDMGKAANGVRNVVGGAENIVEDARKDNC